MKCYLDKNQIERLASNKPVFLHGQKLHGSGAVGELNCAGKESGDTPGTLVMADVCEGDASFLASIFFDDAGLLRRFSCSCDAFGVWRGGCAHVVAAFLAIFERNRDAAAASRSARVSRGLLDAFEKRAFDMIDKRLALDIKPVSPVTVQPMFYTDYNKQPGLQLSIGYSESRKYVVRDVHAFLDAFDKESVMCYGKNLEIPHRISLLDVKSKDLIELLRAERTRQYFSGKALNVRVFTLSPLGMDRFFGIFEGEQIDVNGEINTPRKVSLDSSAPEPCLTFTGRGDGGMAFTLSETAQAHFFTGENFGYILRGGFLHRTSMDYLNALTALIKAFQSTGGTELVMRPADMHRCAAFLLPELRRLGILESASVTEYLPKTLSPRVYLDAENGVVTCVPAFVYDGTELRRGEKTDILRDHAGEYAFARTLELMGFCGTDGEGMTLAGDDAVHGFYYAENGLAKLRGLAEVFATDAFASISRKPVKAPSFGLRINGGLLEVEISGDYTPSELLAALESYRTKKNYHKLPDGRYVNFNGNETVYDQLDALFQGLDVRNKDINKDTLTVPKYRALYAASQLEHAELKLDGGVKSLINDFSAGSELRLTVPETLNGVLRAYQKEGFRWLMTLSHYGFGGILADDMGLGKTIQVIAALLFYKENTPADNRLPSMVVAPTSLIYNWEKEIARFAPDLKTALLSGAAAKRRDDFHAADKTDVYITTYDMLKRDIENYNNASFRYIIADEAQNIKNPGTQNARAVKRLRAEARLALTGTPIENALSELWSIFDFIMPGYLFGAARFTKTYEAPILKYKSESAASGLRRQISPFILRRLKSDVLTELPDKVETTLYADMTEEQRLIYEAYLLKTKGELEENARLGRANENRIEILSMLTRLRQICCHPATFVENYSGGSGKLDLTIETIRASLASGHRVLVFSQFTRMLAILTERLSAGKIQYFYL
ncbi:MAG: SNF2-related protein, partial [Defluviitaleaceae bacterium]|nr:SNF2-related protein [Defluviitaleaceae bacterium]